uniref:Uncharacterized protein n=1 Tax=Eucampia antarctica TaxID=49252 RepID=A0A7S2WGL9_9STRA|mmetsp:Transcript_29678/g.28535  ORF Transcript_29678/g.28535 Transcript_29678/m.28535 type:complete len:215 (+) Transcript_29678:64-708(+)|eukprot:CAMPEP_0197825804 /NCGR_PEP_ID=MMETSP1437-20131217/2842_1 /TAXON_ID=49252 ORGANISM="Eucampia antarctica, Strain CCMP1452" /NCGR_SAMPLE_ID=MMETSP1437 /ASSEMBLY_ACC=CAM_ASM_001096 /LENGTH=214 /DNA_ID=CAMNT_0043425967 /DNA_START=57 /DNA_END=701 /DNA_ORIENTATION=+
MYGFNVVTALSLIVSVSAFSRHPSAFTGREVCSKAELTNELSCPPFSNLDGMRRGNTMSMPPFLKKLGLKKPNFGGEEERDVATLEKSNEKDTSAVIEDEESIVEEELSETQKLMQKVKESGTAGFISYALWELAFWTISVPVCVLGYNEVTGHWPDFQDPEDQKKLGAEAFAFVNFARFAVPLRIGLALSTTPWIQDNLVDKFMKKDEPDSEQ